MPGRSCLVERMSARGLASTLISMCKSYTYLLTALTLRFAMNDHFAFLSKRIEAEDLLAAMLNAIDEAKTKEELEMLHLKYSSAKMAYEIYNLRKTCT